MEFQLKVTVELGPQTLGLLTNGFGGTQEVPKVIEAPKVDDAPTTKRTSRSSKVSEEPKAVEETPQPISDRVQMVSH